MPPAWLTTFPLLERDRLVALLQESSAPLFGEMVPYAITLVYPAPEAAVRVGPSSCEQARSLLSTAPAPSQLSAVGPSLGSSSHYQFSQPAEHPPPQTMLWWIAA